jgi:hypothetical protein
MNSIVFNRVGALHRVAAAALPVVLLLLLLPAEAA